MNTNAELIADLQSNIVGDPFPLMRKAADAIEALEAQNSANMATCKGIIQGLEAEVERLNAKIDEHTKLCVKRVAEVTRERNIAQAQLAAVQPEVERLGMALRGYQVAIETAEESLKDRVALAMEVERLSAAGVSHCGHRPPCIECSKYAAPIPQQPAPGIPTLEQIRAAIEDNLTRMYACTRVWEAWHFGTMSQEDFIHASETEFAEDTANAIQALLAAAPQPKETK